MNPQGHADQQPKRKPEETHQAADQEARAKEARRREAHAKAEEASRSVMHPESFDPEWRYYHGAWGG